jgi:hypothetical protein
MEGFHFVEEMTKEKPNIKVAICLDDTSMNIDQVLDSNRRPVLTGMVMSYLRGGGSLAPIDLLVSPMRRSTHTPLSIAWEVYTDLLAFLKVQLGSVD